MADVLGQVDRRGSGHMVLLHLLVHGLPVEARMSDHPSLPWDIQEAHAVLADASRAQHDHQQQIKDAVKSAAHADHLHRVALANKIAELRDGGTAAALCSKLAQGDETISLLARDAAEKEGDREIAVQEGWRLHASRKDLQELVDWSKRRDLAEGYHGSEEPQWSRRAA